MEGEEKKPNEHQLGKEAGKDERKEIEDSTLSWLQTDSKVKEYLSQFRETDVKSFIEQYPRIKGSFMEFGGKLGHLPEQHQLQYLEEAQKNLMDIQRKKIFDLMCQWDAELIKLEGILCSDDFDDWLEDPNTCPHITPINDDEFALYLRFMETDEYEDSYYYISLSYDDYRDGDPSDDSELLEWCMFENLNTEHGYYFSLPMIRSRKEDVYRKLSWEEREKEFERKYETGELKRHVPDTRKELSCHYYKHLEDFIKQNESREVLNRFRKMYDYFPEQLIRENEDDKEEGEIVSQVENIMYQLAGIKEKIPIEANADWRLGLIEAFEKYEQRQLLNGLRYAYSEYRMKIDLNLGFEKKEDTDPHNRTDFSRKQILRGRSLNGEPEDFNF